MRGEKSGAGANQRSDQSVVFAADTGKGRTPADSVVNDQQLSAAGARALVESRGGVDTAADFLYAIGRSFHLQAVMGDIVGEGIEAKGFRKGFDDVGKGNGRRSGHGQRGGNLDYGLRWSSR